MPYDASALVDELVRKSPDYVFTVSEAVIDGPASDLLAKVIESCPQAFKHISGPHNRFSFNTYQIDGEILKSDPCLMRICQDNRFPVSTQLSLAPQNQEK